MRKLILAAVAAMCASAASAGTVDVAGDFGNPLFRYGYGSASALGGVSFNPFTTSGSCLGGAGTSCRFGPTGSDFGLDLPAIGVNTTGSTVTFANTIVLPTNTLFLHPGSAAVGQDAILQFVAPQAGVYSGSGSVFRLDNTANGNGVTVSLFLNDTPLLSAPILATSGGAPLFQTGSIALAQGDVLSFVVNNNGEFTFDGTGLIGSISSAAVPEPATWALMIGGIGAAGGALRTRRRGTLAAA